MPHGFYGLAIGRFVWLYSVGEISFRPGLQLHTTYAKHPRPRRWKLSVSPERRSWSLILGEVCSKLCICRHRNQPACHQQSRPSRARALWFLSRQKSLRSNRHLGSQTFSEFIHRTSGGSPRKNPCHASLGHGQFHAVWRRASLRQRLEY